MLSIKICLRPLTLRSLLHKAEVLLIPREKKREH
jgi:hypothetical protein